MPKRTIDQIRDAAKVITIAGGNDTSAISEMIPIGDRMYVIKERSIHSVQLADKVDPQCTNADLPDTTQKAFSIGSGSPIVGRTLLTCRALFKRSLLGGEFDEQRGLELSLNFLKNFVALDEMCGALESAETRSQAEWEAERYESRALNLPAVGNVEARGSAFAQKVGHVLGDLKQTAKLFYPDDLSKKWIDSLCRITAKRHGEDSDLCKYIMSTRQALLFMSDMRNMIEHPKPDWRIDISDYHLLPIGQIGVPRLKIIEPGKPSEDAPLAPFMRHILDGLLGMTESLVALLCSARVGKFAGMPVTVIELAPEARRNPNVRFSYGAFIMGELRPIG